MRTTYISGPTQRAHRTVVKTFLLSAATAAAVPAFLFVGAGTAQATTEVEARPQPWGVIMHIQELSGADAWCTYTATPQNSALLPYVSPPFKLLANQSYDLPIPGVPTGTQWFPKVRCDTTGDQTLWASQPNFLVY